LEEGNGRLDRQGGGGGAEGSDAARRDRL